MNAYGALAPLYDALTRDISYESFTDFIEAVFRVYGVQPKTVLDLACGTGSLSVLLAARGYRVLGADASEDMLVAADRKASALSENRPYFIHQTMQELRLPAAVDAAVCCLDSLNYLTSPADVRETIFRLYQNLRPGGVFLFDINSEEKLRALDGQVFLDETDDIYCVWRAEYEEETRLCRYGMDIFARKDSLWRRDFEEHIERAYRVSELAAFLDAAGFRDVQQFGDRVLVPPAPGEQRIFFAARKEALSWTNSFVQSPATD